jgi:hypothetical protein
VQSNDQVADIFTKTFPKSIFENCKQLLGIMKEKNLKEQDLSLRKDVGSSKLQVPILKDQELENPDNLEEAPCRELEKEAHEEQLEKETREGSSRRGARRAEDEHKPKATSSRWTRA